jgi:holo-[acyl-carrier protein] synthase
MIIGIGTDITDSDRFHINGKPKDRLALKIMTLVEHAHYCELPDNLKILYLAKIWSIKEASSKAFGTGICKFLYWNNIEVSKDVLGKPIIKLLNNPNISGHVSTSDEKNHIVSMVLLETC